MLQDALTDDRAPLAAQAIEAHISKLSPAQQLALLAAITKQVRKVAGLKHAVANYAKLLNSKHSGDTRKQAHTALLALAQDAKIHKDVRLDALDALAAHDRSDPALQALYLAAIAQCDEQHANQSWVVECAEKCMSLAFGMPEGLHASVRPLERCKVRWTRTEFVAYHTCTQPLLAEGSRPLLGHQSAPSLQWQYQCSMFVQDSVTSGQQSNDWSLEAVLAGASALRPRYLALFRAASASSTPQVSTTCCSSSQEHNNVCRFCQIDRCCTAKYMLH